jgi:hypothetical protein
VSAVLASTYLERARIAQLRGDWNQALQLYGESQSIADERSLYTTVCAHLGIASIMGNLGDGDVEKFHLLQAYRLAKKSGNRLLMALEMHQHGLAILRTSKGRRGQIIRAINLVQQSTDLLLELGDPDPVMVILNDALVARLLSTPRARLSLRGLGAPTAQALRARVHHLLDYIMDIQERQRRCYVLALASLHYAHATAGLSAQAALDHLELGEGYLLQSQMGDRRLSIEFRRQLGRLHWRRSWPALGDGIRYLDWVYRIR